MQAYRVKVVANSSITLLERILRVIRHRGGTVFQFNAYQEKEMTQIEIGFQSTRSLTYIVRQLDKLIGIQSIESIKMDHTHKV